MTHNKLWCRQEGGSSTELRILGAPLLHQPDGYAMQRLDVFWAGTFREHLHALGLAAREQKLNLAYTQLRARLEMEFSPLLTMDRSLCSLPPPPASVEKAVFSVQQALDVDQQMRLLSQALQSALLYWSSAELIPFAKKYGFEGLADRICAAIGADALRIVEAEGELWSKSAPAELDTLVRYIGQQLHGQELFEGLGNVYLISRPQSRTNWVELMTRPYHTERGSFSMAARVSLETIPYREGYVVKATPSRRIWLKEPPKYPGNVRRTSGYYIPRGDRLAMTFDILRKDRKWELGDDYFALLDRNCDLPLDVAGVCARLPSQQGDWVGMPYHTAYGGTSVGRATFEADDISLFERVCSVLQDLVEKPLAPQEVKITGRTAPKLFQVRLQDFSIEEHDASEELDENVEERQEVLEDQRRFRRDALSALHPGQMPTLWIVAREDSERTLLSKTAETMFGDAVQIRREVLPELAHGLKDLLPGRELGSRARLAQRVAAWSGLQTEISKSGGPAYVLICARKDYEGREEDPVNYFAGIAAMSAAGANVHHVLPPDGPDGMKDFVQRASSALLDVLFGHNGYLHGVDGFLRKHFDDANAPAGIYGVQVIRATGIRFSGQRPVSLVAITMLRPSDSRCWVRYGHVAASGAVLTKWMEFREGLRWVACQGMISLGPPDRLAVNAEGLIAKALDDIHKEDMNALVLADWAALRGIWGSLSDQNLNRGKVGLLSRTDLSAVFPKMRLVRIRRGDSTLPLRAIKSTPYVGFLENPTSGVLTPTGEIHKDVYSTTRKALVKLSNSPHRSAHFLGTHGYGGVPVNMPRGLSAYRYTQRAAEVPDKEGKRLEPVSRRPLFKLEEKKPAYDVSQGTPAPIEITVAMAPSGDAPERIASAVMGLRSGYGHFGSWTGLPAPLFFRGKIEDYFVQYQLPDEEEFPEPSAPEPAGSVTPDRSFDNETSPVAEVSPTPISRAEYAAAIQPDEGIAIKVLGLPVPVVSSKEPFRLQQTSASFEMPRFEALMAGDDVVTQLRKRAFTHFLRDTHVHSYRDALKVDKRVPVPTVITRELIGKAIRVTPRDIRLLWEAMFRNRLDPPGTPRKRPESEAAFLDWFYGNLQIPHFLAAMDSLQPVSRTLQSGLIHDAHNQYRLAFHKSGLPTGQQQLRINAVSWFIQEQMWDEIHWLLFREAQEPDDAYRQVLDNVLKGTEPASVIDLVRYILQCDALVERVWETITASKPSGETLATPRVTAHTTTTERGLSVAESSPIPIPILRAETEASMPDSPQTSPILVLPELHQLRSLVAELDPAAADTCARCAEARRLLDEIEQKHLLSEEEARAVLKLSQAWARLDALAQELPARLADKRLNKEIPVVQMWTQRPDMDVHTVEKKLNLVDAEYARFVSAHEALQAYLRQQPDGVPDPEDQHYIGLFGHVRRARTTIRDVVAELGMLGTTLPSVPIKAPELTPTEPAQPKPGAGPEPAPLAAPARLASDPAAPPNPASELQPEPAVALDAFDTVTRPAMQSPHVVPLAHTAFSHLPAPLVTTEPEAESISVVVDAGAAFARFVHRQEYTLAGVVLARSGDQSGVDPRLVNFALDGAQRAAAQDPASDLTPSELDWAQDVGASIEWSDDPAQQSAALAMMAGMLAPALFSPGNNVVSNFVAVFEGSLRDATPLHELTECLRQLQSHPMGLSPALIRMTTVGGHTAHGEQFEILVKECKEWIDRGPARRQFAHIGVARLQAALYSEAGAITRAIKAIASGSKSATTRALVQEALAELSDPHQLVQGIARKLKEKRQLPHPLVSRVEAGAATTKSLLLKAPALLDEPAANQRSARVESFLVELRSKLDAAHHYVQAIAPGNGFHKGLRLSAEQVLESLLAFYDAPTPKVEMLTREEQLLTIPVVLGVDFRPAAWLTDALVLEELCKLSEQEPASREDRLVAAYDDHLKQLRIYPAEALMVLLGNGTFNEAERKQHRDAVDRQRRRLHERLEAANRHVAMAEAMQSIQSKTARDMQRTLKGIQSAADRIGRYPATNEQFPDFAFAFERIQTHVERDLEANASRARDVFLQMVEAQLHEVPEVMRPRVNKVRELAQMGLGKLMAAREMFRVLKKGEDVSDQVFRNSDLHEFVAFIQKVEALGALDPVRAVIDMIGRGDNNPLLANIAEQREQVVKLLCAWENACREDTPSSVRTDAVKTVLHGLDLRGANPEQQPGGAGVVHYTFDPTVFAGVRPFVPPELGSSTSLDLHVLPARKPTPEQIQGMIGRATRHGLAFIRSRCDAARRAALAADNRAYSKLVLIDDYLCLYLALAGNSRPRRLLQAGLSTCRCAPYKDVSPVPREMFRGREALIDDIRNLSGGRILYGGRRLGKTSVLDAVEQIIRNERRAGEFAVRVNMEKLPTANYRYEAWNRIHNDLVKAKVMPSAGMAGGTNHERIIKALSKALDDPSIKTVMLMLDEADDLMEADAESMLFVGDLNKLTEKYGHSRFRFVIAGLHNVQRLLRAPNSPLRKMDSPFAIKPFIEQRDREAGIQLIVEPFAALGFEFDEVAMPFLILANNHFYPALVQEYCKSLLNVAYKERGTAPAPFTIKWDLIAKMEKDTELATKLREKFEGNLDLDTRYMVIAYIFALRQYETTDSADKLPLMSRSELRSECEVYAPGLFARAEDHVYECLLEEMVNLNLLEKDGSSRYMLATPNIAFMLGTREHIEEELERRSRISEPPHKDPLSEYPYHPDKKKVFPLNYGLLHTCTADQGRPVTVLVGNKASGLDHLKHWEGIIPGTNTINLVYHAGMPLKHARARQAFRVNNKMPTGPGDITVHVFESGCWSIGELTLLNTLVKELEPTNGRIWLIADIDGQALELARREFKGQSLKGMRVEVVPPWSTAGIETYLQAANRGVRSSHGAAEPILAATGGFCSWIEQICQSCQSDDDVKNALEIGKRSFLPPSSQLFPRLGIDARYERLVQGLIDGKADARTCYDRANELGFEGFEVDYLRWMGLLKIRPDGVLDANELIYAL